MVWWPFAVALQGEIANHREVRRSRAGVLSVAEKARCQRVRCGSRRRAKAIPPMKCRKRIGDIKTGVESLPRDQPGGSLLTGQVVSGMNGGASVVRALVRNSGTCRPDGMAGQWSGLGLRLVVWSENPKQLICEGESSDAGHRGGPDCIARRAGRVACWCESSRTDPKRGP